jgi:dinuclear metal center YbgI/SA1388 family protein
MQTITVSQVASIIESFSPLGLQENYDNAGLAIGSPSTEVKGILIALDVTPEIADEAIATGCNLIIAHHPIIFNGLKRITGATLTERIVIKAIQNDIAIYAAHTNLDSVWGGVSHKMAEKLNLSNIKVLSPANNQLAKLVTFAPTSAAQKVRQALFDSGAGNIGNYDSCSYNTEGQGTFRGSESTNPFVGEKGELHFEPETRIEVIVPKPIISKVVAALKSVHPYEEVAFDIYPLENKNPKAGLGVIGSLQEPLNSDEFLQHVKTIFNCTQIKHSNIVKHQVKKIALCGGSGFSLLNNAISQNADIFITADIKYHGFFETENKILLVDIGHYESELFAIDIFYELLTKNLPTFAIRKTSLNTNPINYL